jgi:tRNA nucleotidyltransferase/poly(A) polymerase
LKIPADIRARFEPLAREAGRLGTPLYFVGGCVRDWLIGKETLDVDLAVEGESAPLARAAARLWGGSAEEFDRFGTVRVSLPGGGNVDFARTRSETYARPAALPQVQPAASIQEDLARRDFSVNALALRAGSAEGEIVDPHGGVQDLKDRRLRVLHARSFEDDPTRLLRGARYAARFGLAPEPETARLMKDAVERRLPALLSRERLRQELWRTLEENDPAPAFARMEEWGLLVFLHPRLKWVPSAGLEPDAACRLGLCAMALGEEGSEFLSSLKLDRNLSRGLLAALKAAQEGRSPIKPLPDFGVCMLRAGIPNLSPAAAQPLVIDGRDLQRLGLKPGPEFSRILNEAAAAQWKGVFHDKESALSWLKKSAASGNK